MKHTIFGESHGPAIGVVLTDVPAGIPLDEEFISHELDRRAPGKNALSTARKEADRAEILSGVFQGRTTGTPLCMVIRNTDQHSGDYETVKRLARPGHADLPGHVRYGGWNDYRGGGHFSGRLTAPLVAAGAVAKLWLMEKGVKIAAHIADVGGIFDDVPDFAGPDMDALTACGEKAFPVINDGAGAEMQKLILACREAGDSVGGSIRCFIAGVPMGLGAPDYDRNAETCLARQLFAVPAVKALEFGEGFGFSSMRGSAANDPWAPGDRGPVARSNRNGGILGGITTGMPIVFRVGIKPTPSIAIPQDTVDMHTGQAATLELKGRHDPCIVHRAVPVVEAAAALAAMELMLHE